jgi:hypothetical protein
VQVQDGVERDLGSLRLPGWGRVVPAAGVVVWQVVDPGGRPVEPIQRFLRDFVARLNNANGDRIGVALQHPTTYRPAGP